MNLKNKKTYLAAGVGVVTSIAYSLGYLNREAFEAIGAIFGFGALAALRAAVDKKPSK